MHANAKNRSPTDVGLIKVPLFLCHGSLLTTEHVTVRPAWRSPGQAGRKRGVLRPEHVAVRDARSNGQTAHTTNECINSRA